MSDAPPRPELDEERLAALREFFAKIDLEPRDWGLIDIAFTHTSYAFENDLQVNNERLEFLGDAVIGLLVAKHLFSSHRQIGEGDLSKQKAQLVSRNVLGRLAHDLGMGPLMRLGRGEDQTGGRKRLSLIGSALEALIGAIYLDLGLDAARTFIAPVLLNVHDTITQHEEFQDYKSQLQEQVQRLFGSVPHYQKVDSEGPDHDKTFHVEVSINGIVWGEGKGRRVKSAENRAARAALAKLEAEPE